MQCEWETRIRLNEGCLQLQTAHKSQCQWPSGLVANSLVHSSCKAESWSMNGLKAWVVAISFTFNVFLLNGSDLLPLFFPHEECEMVDILHIMLKGQI